MNPVCQNCIYLSNEPVKFRRCPKIPIFHRDMLCNNPKNAVKDHIDGDLYSPFCEEVNRHGECLVYYPVGLEPPRIAFDDFEDNLIVCGTNPFIITLDGTEPNAKMQSVGEWDEMQEVYIYEQKILNTCVPKVACVKEGVLSGITEIKCEVPDVPVIKFDKTTNTVTIESYNKVYFTVDGTNVTDESPVYDGPFVIDHNTVVKARSYAREDLSVQVSEYCISIEAPVIEFDPDTNKVTLTADDTILYSLDGTDIYDDSNVYEEPIEITKNTTVKAACLVDGELSEQVEKECKVANPPVISYDEKTHKVTIESENTVRYTLDGTDPKKSSTEYTGPFTISETCTVTASSFTDEKESQATSLECIYIGAPVISFDTETNTVSISGDYTILYSTDGSKIYDDSDEYTDPFVIDKNTTVKAACIFNGVLSDEVTLVCKVPSMPKITFNSSTKVVTITGENTILYTTDGSDVKKKDAEYKSPFKITATSTIKAKAYVNDKESEQAELECVI